MEREIKCKKKDKGERGGNNGRRGGECLVITGKER